VGEGNAADEFVDALDLEREPLRIRLPALRNTLRH
jgi:hypothetical protein